MHPLGGRTAERMGRRRRPEPLPDRRPATRPDGPRTIPHRGTPQYSAGCDNAPFSRRSRVQSPRPPGKMTGDRWEELTTRRRNREPGASERVRHPMDTPLPGCGGARHSRPSLAAIANPRTTVPMNTPAKNATGRSHQATMPTSNGERRDGPALLRDRRTRLRARGGQGENTGRGGDGGHVRHGNTRRCRRMDRTYRVARSRRLPGRAG
jgi:hypothetical protein